MNYLYENALHIIDHQWLDLKFHSNSSNTIYKPDELEKYLKLPPKTLNPDSLRRIRGSMFGLALGDALGAHVEFRPHGYLMEHPVSDLGEGGTWGLKKGQVSHTMNLTYFALVD